MIEFQNPSQAANWAAEQKRDVFLDFATRIALRVFPGFAYDQGRFLEEGLLDKLRLLISVVACRAFPQEEIKAQTEAAMHSFHFPSGVAGSSSAAAITSVGEVALRSFAPSNQPHLINTMLWSAITVCGETPNASTVFLEQTGVQRLFEQVQADANSVSQTPSSVQLRELRLWNDTVMPGFLQNGWALLIQHFDSSNDWSFWRDWYQGFLDGNPLEWELQRRVALIENGTWAAGPRAVAEEIEKVRSLFHLEEQIKELEAELRRSTASRYGIGGNMPPEMLEDAPIASELRIVKQPLEELKEECAKVDPNPRRLKKIIEALITALKEGVNWCLKKSDLVVDTAIKWAIPAGGTGYLAINPEKLEAVIVAAKKLLSAF